MRRNKDARPRQALVPSDLAPASHIFISHGHFDHIMDVPAIARETGAVVCCSPTAARTLTDMGMDPGRIQTIDCSGQTIDFGNIRARAQYSRHIRFDVRLMAATLIRVGRRLPRLAPLLFDFPCGQVLAWEFEVEGRIIRFFGSGGSTRKELEAVKDNGTDILLLPLQGHSDICKKAAAYVSILEPALVIVHHHDNFFPPLSQAVDIAPFVDRVNMCCPGTDVRVMAVNETICLER